MSAACDESSNLAISPASPAGNCGRHQLALNRTWREACVNLTLRIVDVEGFVATLRKLRVLAWRSG